MSMAKRMGNKGSWVMYNVGDMVRFWGSSGCFCLYLYFVLYCCNSDGVGYFMSISQTACKQCFIVCVYAASEGVEEYMDA